MITFADQRRAQPFRGDQAACGVPSFEAQPACADGMARARTEREDATIPGLNVHSASTATETTRSQNTVHLQHPFQPQVRFLVIGAKYVKLFTNR